LNRAAEPGGLIRWIATAINENGFQCESGKAQTLPPGRLRRRSLPLQLYEKRKLAALEVEQVVKQLAGAGRTERIDEVISALTSYATSSQASRRAGGVVAGHAGRLKSGCGPGGGS
jgi:hypothetical protein